MASDRAYDIKRPINHAQCTTEQRMQPDMTGKQHEKYQDATGMTTHELIVANKRRISSWILCFKAGLHASFTNIGIELLFVFAY
jgi:hypothetical protein